MVSLRTAGMCASLIILVSGISAVASEPFIKVSPTLLAREIAQSTQTPSRLLTRRVQRDLAKRLNVTPSSLQVVEAIAQTWPDQCLGLARPNERCMGGEIRGWQIQVTGGQQIWTYRTDRTGQRLRLEPLLGTAEFGRGDFSAEVSQRLLETVAQQVQQPIANLKVLEVQPATWNGCLGIFEPDTFCTEIAIAGFRTIISDGQASWVYHLSEDGTQIAQNTTASGARSPVSTLFAPVETEPIPDDLAPEVIFQSQLSSDLVGSVQITALTADGTLYREQSSVRTEGVPTRTVIRQLSPAEVTAFQSVVEQQRFPNFNRMRYLTDAAFADYPTTRLEAPGTKVEYIDLEEENLPTSLKNVIAAWQAIAPTETTAPDTPVSDSKVGWAEILGPISAPEGWQVGPCDNPVLLCIQKNEELLGTVERFSHPLSDLELQTPVANTENARIEFLEAWVADQYAAIERDREIADSSLVFTSDTPEKISIGGLTGLRYGYTATHPNGTLFDQSIGYVTTDGERLHVFATGVISGDPSGSFSDPAVLAEFEPHLDDIIRELSL